MHSPLFFEFGNFFGVMGSISGLIVWVCTLSTSTWSIPLVLAAKPDEPLSCTTHSHPAGIFQSLPSLKISSTQSHSVLSSGTNRVSETSYAEVGILAAIEGYVAKI